MNKIKLFIIGVLASTICFTSCDNTPKEPNTYDFERAYGVSDGYDLPIIKVKLGNETVNFIVDSGSEANIISTSYYNKHKDVFNLVGSTDYVLSTMDTETRMTGLILNTIIEDSLPVTFTTMSIDPMLRNVANKQGVTIKGILGVKFLYDHNVIINFNNKEVKVHTNIY